MDTCTTCKYYDLTAVVEIDGVEHHACKRNAPIVHPRNFNAVGTWPVVIPQTPVCGEYKKK